MTTKPKKSPKKKPPLTQAEKNGGRYAAEVAAAKRDGWEGRSAALTAWGKGEGIMVRAERLAALSKALEALEAGDGWMKWAEAGGGYKDALKGWLKDATAALLRLDGKQKEGEATATLDTNE